MAECQKENQKEFQRCCEGMPFADMMRKMLEGKKSGEFFNCADMMSQMMQMCCGAARKKAESTPSVAP